MMRRGAARQGDGEGERDVGQNDEEDEEQEFPDNVECEDYDEEDVYVMVELPSSFDSEELLSASNVTVQGIGTSNPILKVGHEVMKGKTEPIVGTSVVFKTPPPGASGSQPLELACYSNIRMNFNSPGFRRRKRHKK